MYSLQATQPGINDLSEHSTSGVSDVIRCSSRYRFYLFHLYFSVLEILVFRLRVVSDTAQPEMGSGVVLASILLPTELLIALWRRDSLCSFPTSITHKRFQERGELFDLAPASALNE